ncbi:hypothetical protein A2715_03365 [Candidatus Woesebacteria bacterium RIFCSPHIGHO2_01_FULL_39_32]|uniref:CARDB domain-containing protein n=1 Tax=Candidatus Woesebacteria bacterium RIFCSPLOWO2_01_FULL_39_25 TaxID=1802521 RepID=A0A1F8BKL3_9BACT|nr:MAG: hypothetical protein A2124_00035 [Candidatus Woesebacteria bacterium GWB1_37_5]OGM24778.1 MAG: hypothetical protein A2715_03365 [Candidatus Woesebacteria bacterium RIFCSPHIGHO2_01_FULL_39_32]OGM37099.1 MAG: hypothetical protein A3F01_05305 [Candidatus Woesebacteria bacterium RIFCSPHIGHO2_12_FULL_38_11]OGM64604.1 MAG: hypothetical protein A2893_06280 [Candidatus Woesebacteria bacterium RIFCSPLOWO2_01_FULL_39_25]
MKDLFKGKVVTALVVIATVILAGVAIFTAVRLYQLRREPVAPTAPESEPAAWDCSKYTFSVSGTGVVSVNNQSTRNEPSQQAKVYINGNLVNTFDVPALPMGQSATLGTVQVPTGSFNWRVVGTQDCQSSGTSSGGPVACESLAFSLTENSPTPTITGTVTPSLTPTSTPTGTPSPTLPPDVTATPTPTNPPGATSTSTPTPTQGGGIAAASPTPGGAALPDAGISTPTLLALTVGILMLIGALLLAL